MFSPAATAGAKAATASAASAALAAPTADPSTVPSAAASANGAAAPSPTLVNLFGKPLHSDLASQQPQQHAFKLVLHPHPLTLYSPRPRLTGEPGSHWFCDLCRTEYKYGSVSSYMCYGCPQGADNGYQSFDVCEQCFVQCGGVDLSLYTPESWAREQQRRQEANHAESEESMQVERDGEAPLAYLEPKHAVKPTFAAVSRAIIRDPFQHLASPLPSRLKCGICSKPVVDPPNLKCAHLFCMSCITSHRKKSKQCPTCQTSSERLQLSVNSYAQQEMSLIETHCPLRGQGCNWTGVIGPQGANLEAHYATCSCHTVRCSICNQLMERNEWQRHCSECPQLTVECGHCHGRMLYKLLKDHQAEPPQPSGEPLPTTPLRRAPLPCRGMAYCPRACEDPDKRGFVSMHPKEADDEHGAACPKALRICTNICPHSHLLPYEQLVPHIAEQLATGGVKAEQLLAKLCPLVPRSASASVALVPIDLFSSPSSVAHFASGSPSSSSDEDEPRPKQRRGPPSNSDPTYSPSESSDSDDDMDSR